VFNSKSWHLQQPTLFSGSAEINYINNWKRIRKATV